MSKITNSKYGLQVNYEIIGSSIKELRKDENVALILHGWGGSLESQRKLAVQLVGIKAYSSVILVDLPGFGNSDIPKDAIGVEDYSEIVFSVLSELKVERVSVIGHSFGGGVCAFMSTQPQDMVKIENLILVAPAIIRENKVSVISKVSKRFPILGFIVNSLKVYKKAIFRVLYPNSSSMAVPEMEHVYRRIVQQDLTADLKRISVPTLIIAGENDNLVPQIECQKVQKLVSGSKIVVLQEASHNFPLVKSEETALVISQFLNDNGR